MTGGNGMPAGRGYVYGASTGHPSPTRATGSAPAAPLSAQLGASGTGAGRQPHLHVSRLQPHPDNVREELGDLGELAASIKAHGILQPIVVEPHPAKPGHFRIIAGHRRYEAALIAGLDMVPVTFRQPGGTAEELMLIENLHRAELNPMDKAEALGKLREKGRTVAEISRQIGLAEPTIYSYLSLLELDAASRARVRRGELAASEAMEAIRRTRKKRRRREGKPEMGGGQWEPDHFTAQHPLARRAQALCNGREHSMRRRVGRLACGECWETVIRDDERTVQATLAAQDGPAAS